MSISDWSSDVCSSDRLIVAAVVSGVASLGDVRKLGRLGGITVAYYFITTAMAVLLGLVLVNIIQPGVGLSVPAGVTVDLSDKDVGVTEILLSLVHPNIVSAAAEGLFLPLIVFSLLLGA